MQSLRAGQLHCVGSLPCDTLDARQRAIVMILVGSMWPAAELCERRKGR
jgi:hypothetical protein